MKATWAPHYLWILEGIYPLQLCHQILPLAYGYHRCAFTFELEKKTPSFCLLWLTFLSSVIFLLFGETKHPGSERKPIQQDINICYSGNLNEGLVTLKLKRKKKRKLLIMIAFQLMKCFYANKWTLNMTWKQKTA